MAGPLSMLGLRRVLKVRKVLTHNLDIVVDVE
jgi:hypothetical protein